MLEYYQISSTHPQEVPYPSVPNPNPTGPSCPSGTHQASSFPTTPTPYFRRNFNGTQSQRSTHAHPHKRIRTSESPPSTHRPIPSSYTPSSPSGPLSLSSCSASVDQPPRPRDAMAIGSLLSRRPCDDVDDSLQKRSADARG